MATIYPENWRELRAAFMHDAERELLDQLVRDLPDDYAVFPNLPWVTLNRNRSKFGEIDFCVVTPSGDLVIIEQKNGGLALDEQGRLLKSYSGAPGKDVGQQILNSVNTVKRALKDRYRGRGAIAVDYLLVCPNYRLRSYQGLQLNPQRIVDSTALPRLGAILIDIFGGNPASPEHVGDVVNFLVGELDVEPDLGASMERQQAIYRSFSTQLGDWIDRFDFTPYALHVSGCAGSGKTQLARHFAGRALAAGKRPLYTCFNRPLADALRPFFPDDCKVANLDQLCREFLEAHAAMPAFDNPGPDFFERLREKARSLVVPEAWRFDLLVVDEGQDFDQTMAETARHFLRDGGDLVWLDDPLQRLQERAYAPDCTVRLRLDRNYRSPHLIGEAIRQLLALHDMTPANPVAGEEPRLHFYEKKNFPAVLEKCVAQQLQRFSPAEIAIVSLRGRDSSLLGSLTEIARQTLKRFTGRYEDNGTPVFTPGELPAETIYRFKGQQARSVILIDVDFPEVTERWRNLLYCGMTRATFSLDILLTVEAAQALGNYACAAR